MSKVDKFFFGLGYASLIVMFVMWIAILVMHIDIANHMAKMKEQNYGNLQKEHQEGLHKSERGQGTNRFR
jgi:hypothetical protein